MADAKPKPSRAKSTKVNFVLLKQILENESSDTTEVEYQGTTSEGTNSDQDDESTEKIKKKKENFGPTGQYPVLFSRRCKSKSCQTKLSSFPLFAVPEDTEWLSDEEDSLRTKKSKTKSDEKKKRRRGSSDSKTLKSGKSKGKEKEVNRVEEKTKNPDGTRKDFRSEHQLKDTKNPVLQAWLHHKNKIARKTRKEERKVKRAQRAALEEEERMKNERFEESDKRVSEWFKAKRKEARKAWKQNHPKISPFEMASDEPITDSPPPPDYRIIRSFKSQHSSSVGKQRSGSACSSTKSFGMNKSNTSGVNEHFTSKTEVGRSSPLFTKLRESHNIRDGKYKEELTKEENNEVPKATPVRPKTAYARTPTRKTPASSRPKTATTKTTPNEKQQINKSTTKMHNLSYDEWLRLKREQDKKSVVERRKELIDAHLDAVIEKLGKQRVENIMSPRKQVDTGLKNYHRTAPKSAATTKKSSYKWAPEPELPRPEPQGCDCPEAEHIDGKTSLLPSDSLVSTCDTSAQSLPSPSTKKKQAVFFCKEVTDKCEDLKPSMDKVLAVLDAEIQKHKDKNTVKKIPSYKAPSGISTTNATMRTDGSDSSSGMGNLGIPGVVESDVLPTRPKFLRPKSARPRPAFVSNTNLTVEEARKKILHDMDVLGLCEDTNEAGNINNTSQTSEKKKSTVRSNYFDYGTDVDTPTMEKIDLSES